MTINSTLCSSRSEEWPTPQTFFDAVARVPTRGGGAGV